jgi:hypothetical protein
MHCRSWLVAVMQRPLLASGLSLSRPSGPQGWPFTQRPWLSYHGNLPPREPRVCRAGILFWGVRRAQFIKEEREYKSHARAKYYGSRYRSSRGEMYTGLVLEAWSSGIITNHSAAEFMGIKNIAHLHEIRNRFGGA